MHVDGPLGIISLHCRPARRTLRSWRWRRAPVLPSIVNRLASGALRVLDAGPAAWGSRRAFVKPLRMGGRAMIRRLLAVVLLAASMPLSAAVVQMNFTGTISTTGSFVDPSGLLPQGQAISGFWRIDTDSVDADPATTRGAYAQSGVPAFRIVIGSTVFESTSTTIQILDDHTLGIGTIDAYDVLTPAFGATSNVASFTDMTLQLTFRDTEAPLDALSADLLPPGAPVIGAFDQVGQVQGQILGFFAGSTVFVNLVVDSVSAQPVPVPAAVWLLGSAMIGLVGVSRRRGV
jgi:hypothetical protein